jgi:hypothetical protein
MFSNLFKPTQLIDETSIDWMFDTFSWALRNFDAEVFFNETILVTPSNEHFPGREDSAEGMANLIFGQVKGYAGMQHWPFRVVDGNTLDEITPVQVQIEGRIRGKAELVPTTIDESKKLVIPYHEEHFKDPEVVIANFAHNLAHYLGTTAREAPPGGEENWPHVTELLAVFMGFGLMMANSANTSKIRSCSSCAGPAIERENYLSQYDITYALALFCCSKGLSANIAVKGLKSSLRPFFKKAMKDVNRRKSQLMQLQGMSP